MTVTRTLLLATLVICRHYNRCDRVYEEQSLSAPS
uniref:Uncharacterized protein n=1 Tax=Siphoviridae sp. ctkkB9 TaxID=2825644 RepID=A0A8S5TZG0_9CAUD|nr:MAG TPA: hypothetical protein [Siphoviridae sp. ctkkB9]